jgi:hypothetical protein
MSKPNIHKLNRYTTLSVLLDLLQRKKLTLLNPETWEDKNDSEIILEYKRRKGIKNLYALCLSYGDETLHHWKTYSNGTSGCLIEFDANKLFENLNLIPNLTHRKVRYMKLKEIEKKYTVIDIDEIPFVKRWPYRCEEEYRIIVTSEKDDKFFDIDINDLSIIKKITISQQMPEQIYNTIKNYLKELGGNPDRRINRSTLYENNRWINRFKK